MTSNKDMSYSTSQYPSANNIYKLRLRSLWWKLLAIWQIVLVQWWLYLETDLIYTR